MLKLIIEDDEGRKTVVPFVRDEITIGRQEGNTIRLTERNVSRRHARLLRNNGSVVVEDLGSYNGIRINGERIHGQVKIQDGDLIQIGDYDLAIQREASQPAQPPLIPAPPAPASEPYPSPEATTELSATATLDALPPPESPPLAPPSAKDEAAKRLSTAIIRVEQVETRTRQVVELDPSEAPRLVALNTEFSGREYACVRTELRVGRADDNDIAIDHRSLSRTHAKIVREDDGEWRVIDLQSANGLKVNDEPYAQAALRNGDILELGHVRLRFVGPGESFTFVPEDGGHPRSRGPLIAWMLLLLVAAAGAGVYVTYFHPASSGEDPAPHPGTHTPEPPIATAPPPVRESPPEEKLASARRYIEARDFDRATDALESALLPDGSLHPDATELLTQLKNEEPNRRALDRAEKAIASGQLEEADRALKESARTQLLAGAHASLKEQLAKRRPAAPAAPAAPDPEKLFEEGVALARNKQLPDARRNLEKCVKVAPRHAGCHKYLGGVFARLAGEEADDRAKDKLNRLGLTHYRRFLQLAPNDPDATRVRKIVSDYAAQ